MATNSETRSDSAADRNVLETRNNVLYAAYGSIDILHKMVLFCISSHSLWIYTTII